VLVLHARMGRQSLGRAPTHGVALQRTAWMLAASALLGACSAECVLYPQNTLTYCPEQGDRFVSDRNYPAARAEAAAMLTAQMICDQDWAAGAEIVGGSYGDFILPSEICLGRTNQCKEAARLFSCAEAMHNKDGLYYDTLRNPLFMSEFQLTNYEQAPARVADELWRAELGGDCTDGPVEPAAADCCKALFLCNATSVAVGGYSASPSEFCSSVVWASGRTVVCGADGSASFIAAAGGLPVLHGGVLALLVILVAARVM
jgi:hypothetical protein